MRPSRLVPLALVLLLVGALALMAMAPATTPAMTSRSVSKAEEQGWRSTGDPETERFGPFGLARLRSESWERSAQGVTLGEFYVFAIKSPVWLPRSVLVSAADEKLHAIADANGVSLRAAEPAADPAGASVLEYDGTPLSGSLYSGEVGVILRVLPCDLAGNVVVAAGFGVKDVSSGLLGARLRVYEDEVKGVLAPSVGCP